MHVIQMQSTSVAVKQSIVNTRDYLYPNYIKINIFYYYNL